MNTTAERYAVAVNSSNLRWDIELRAIDAIGAAGTVREPLGLVLVRLLGEWDRIGRDRLMMFKLASAVAVRDILIAMAMANANRRGVPISLADAKDIAKNLVDLWLEPKCERCSGRGAIHAYGAPQRKCDVCRGTGDRQVGWPKGQEIIANRLRAQMAERINNAMSRLDVKGLR